LKAIPYDFYLSPLDWGRSNLIAIALITGVEFVNPSTHQISDFPISESDPTSLKFDSKGDKLALGTDRGILSAYSVDRHDWIWTAEVSAGSVLCCTWHNSTIFSGSRDGTLCIADTRSSECCIKDEVHSEEICSICFQRESDTFATSSNDTTVKIWDLRQIESPVSIYREHTAAVRALSWSPIAPDVIASAGGTSDRTIRIWNVNSRETSFSVDTKSQVCNLYWNEEYNEILSTHGFSQHQLALWRGADLTQTAVFLEHKQRVLYLAASPDGTQVATAAPSDDLLIWKLFPSKRRGVSEAMLSLR
jgi:WD40 repeat protein